MSRIWVNSNKMWNYFVTKLSETLSSIFQGRKISGAEADKTSSSTTSSKSKSFFYTRGQPPIKPRPHDPDVIRIDAALYKKSTEEKKSSDSLSDIPFQQHEIETQTCDVVDGQDTPGKRQVVVQQQRNKNQPIIIKKPHLENRERLDDLPVRPRPPKLKPKRPPLPKDGLPASEELIVASLAERRAPQATLFDNSPNAVTSRGNTTLDANHWIVPSSETQTSRRPSTGTPKEKPKRPSPPRDYPSPPPSLNPYRTPPSRIPPPKPPRVFMKSEKLNKTEQQMGVSNEKPNFERVGTHHPVPDFEEAVEEVLEENQVKRCHLTWLPLCSLILTSSINRI